MIHFTHDRHELIFTPETGAVQMRLDGRGLIDTLSYDERMKLSLALWASVPQEVRRQPRPAR